MKRIGSYAPEFVDSFPSDMQPGIVYVSIAFATVAHRCACGCGREVITPLSPSDWKLIYDGENVSLDPSIGSWSFPCRSHYFIRNGSVRWAGSFDNKAVAAIRKQDKVAKAARQAERQTGDERTSDAAPSRPSLVVRIRRWLPWI